MERDIIKIDEEKCNGCGLCVPNCHEGALQVIDGKVRLVSELMCDGLGACIGHCPEDAITIEKREAEPYSESAVLREMISKGPNTVIAHLKHLKDHKEYEYLKEGVSWLQANKSMISFDVDQVISTVHNHGRPQPGAVQNMGHHHHGGGGCPGSSERVIAAPVKMSPDADIPSELRHWPVQMHLINPNAPFFRGADLLLAADCVAFSLGSFHSAFLRGKSLAIACPKLDHGAEIYIEKIAALVDVARVNTITVMMMEVPCCGGLLQMVRTAIEKTTRKVPVKMIMVSIDGKILRDDWV
ncbi:MAG: 4Fe-4S binding protein [Bacteroidales bacterium]|jgi:NAD-dependent dihydropyrimidine dehydrogenase PreA subunit|nr:4Fe-4S binding protein [Bacteroidales bacterium]